MDYELPTDFDLIVVGTGVVESVVSAAASRIGKRVLHIDSNNYYGSVWASFNLEQFQKLGQTPVLTPEHESEKNDSFLKESERLFSIKDNEIFNLKNFEVEWHIPNGETVDNKEQTDESCTDKNNEWTREKLLKESRKFNLDLSPKLQFARGDFVELLISSNIARYSEYRSVSRVLTWLNGQLEIVPCSRSDVFANNKVSVIEKRMLMKLLTSLDDENLDGCANKTFEAYLKEKKLTPNLIHYVLYAISMSTAETSCVKGIENTKRFLNSLGRFGKTPFLFSMYGSGEITQAFCRLSAVFGTIYALNQPLNGIIFDNENKFKGLVCGKQRIESEKLVLSAEKTPVEFINERPRKFISRAVLITNKSIMKSEKEHLTLLLYPPENGNHSIVVIELGTLTGTCPQGLYIVHLIAEQTNNPKNDFQSCIEKLFKQDDNLLNPKILFSAYFSIPNSNHIDLASLELPQCMKICPGPDNDLDYDYAIRKAKNIFVELYGQDVEFLPRAPDPEEIVIEGEESEGKGDDGEVKLEAESDEAKIGDMN